MTRVGIVTQARTTSTRLPGKVLALVGGRTLLDLHLERLAASDLETIVATTVNHTDDAVVEVASARGVACFRGSEHDVLARFAGCAEEHRLDVVVRVTSDCPLVDGRLVAEAVDVWAAADDPRLYLSNALHRSFPRGLDLEVFGTGLLVEAAASATRPEHREHVTPYLYDVGPELAPPVTLRNLWCSEDHSDLRVTVDTPADLDLVRRLVEVHGAALMGWRQIVDVLRAHPDLVAVNAHVVQKRFGAHGRRH